MNVRFAIRESKNQRIKERERETPEPVMILSDDGKEERKGEERNGTNHLG